MSKLWLPGDPTPEPPMARGNVTRGDDGLLRPTGTVQEDADQKAVHICRDEHSPALCGAFSNQPPQAWPDWARWVRLTGKIYLANCHKCQQLAGYTESPEMR